MRCDRGVIGRELAERSASYADAILAAARSTELEETGRELNEIVVAAQQFNVDSLDNPASRTPIVGPLLKKFSLTREKALARFDTVKGQVDKLVERVEQTADTLDRRNTDYHAMYESVRQEHAALGRHVCLADQPPVDLFIRTGGEVRVSNFLLWQIAYAELYFTDALWPDFDAAALDAAIDAYARRERRFGQTSAQLRVAG